MYKCCDCGHIFEIPEIYYEDRSPACSFEGGSFIEEYNGCPICGGAFNEVQQCDLCNDYYVNLNKYINKSICDNCLKEIERVEKNESGKY